MNAARRACTGGSLYQHLTPIARDHRLVHVVTRQLLQVLVYMHACGVAHGDIKPENFMFLSEDAPLNDPNNLVAIDFNACTTSRAPPALHLPPYHPVSPA